jgi:hypothetical protein
MGPTSSPSEVPWAGLVDVQMDGAGQRRGGPILSQPTKIPWLWPQTQLNQRVSVRDWDPQQSSVPEHSGLNDGPPPGRVPRLFSLRTLRYNAGLRQYGMQQSFHQAYLPPPVVTVTQSTRIGARSIGGILGAGTTSASVRHLPSAFVPRTIT